MHTTTGAANKHSNDAEQHYSDDEGDNHDHRVDLRCLPEHDRPDQIVDRHAQAYGECHQKHSTPELATADRDETDDRGRREGPNHRDEFEYADCDREQDGVRQPGDHSEPDPCDKAGIDDHGTRRSVTTQHGDDARKQHLHGLTAFGRDQPNRAGCQIRTRDHEIGHQHPHQEGAKDTGHAQAGNTCSDLDADKLLHRLEQPVRQSISAIR